MVKVCLKLDHGTPQYACSSCSNCHSVYGKSMCKIKSRGCCWYFPKFTLYEIHKMSKNNLGRETLRKILNIESTKIYNYYIHAKGYFDKASFNKYISSNNQYEDVQDKSIFFRACPFVEPEKGCALPQQYRSFVCNFFICEEVKKVLKGNSEFRDYIKECNSYVRWIDWENAALRAMLDEKNINLVDNLNKVIEFLSEVPLENFEFRKLKELKVAGE
ncbi:hypothetical protein NL50_09480 [Clostridium acetobutylicum]|nr:hypothetical protein NL50_09480 [Clostridium acetobutylicum]